MHLALRAWRGARRDGAVQLPRVKRTDVMRFHARCGKLLYIPSSAAVKPPSAVLAWQYCELV